MGTGRARNTRRAILTLIVATFAATTLVLTTTGSTARACSCASVDPIDAVGIADVVFTGTVLGNEGSEFEPVWRFEVDGIVKGEVGPIEVVTGSDWASGCGTNFGQFTQPVVVYASNKADDVEAVGCMPTPTAAEFASRLASIVEPTGTGPPAALMVGTVGANDVAILDPQGNTIARAHAGVGAGIAAYCSGTTLAAVASDDSRPTVALIDLTSLSVVEDRPIDSSFASVSGDRIACIHAGDRIVVATGYGPNDGSVTIATSNEASTGVSNARRAFDGVSRAVIHPNGNVFLLPSSSDVPFQLASSADLVGVSVDDVLPQGAAVLDGDVSIDGTVLAMLATLDGRAIEWNTGATHVITVDLVDGVPVPGTASTVALRAPGDNRGSPTGGAKWIRWVDDGVWVVEHETNSTKMVEFVSTDGTQLLAPTDVGWGWGLAPLGDGVLRTRNGGVEIITPDGTSLHGDPAPLTNYIDRLLSVVALRGAPAFTPVPTAPVDVLTITPVTAETETPDEVSRTDPSSTATTTTTQPVPTESTDEAAAAVAGPPDANDSTGMWAPRTVVSIVVLAAASTALLWQTRRRWLAALSPRQLAAWRRKRA